MINSGFFKYCPYCGKLITDFKDELSLKEFQISGLCQICQDEVFKNDDNEENDDEIN